MVETTLCFCEFFHLKVSCNLLANTVEIATHNPVGRQGAYSLLTMSKVCENLVHPLCCVVGIGEELVENAIVSYSAA